MKIIEGGSQKFWRVMQTGVPAIFIAQLRTLYESDKEKAHEKERAVLNLLRTR